MFKWGSRAKANSVEGSAQSGKPQTPPEASSENARAAHGRQAEDLALAHLQRHGLRLIERNYRVAGGPSARAGEVDLIMRDADGTLVFVEVRWRRSSEHGGAAASVTSRKQSRLIYAAQHYLQRHASPPPCRFDVVACSADQLEWLRAAFDGA